MRVASLDLIRGVAVLGILAINIAGFAGPSVGALTPSYPVPAQPWDQAAFAVSFVLFEGKMRALFAILFGASMAVFLDRAEAQGRDGERLQAKRLAWLLLFGGLHYVFLWWGDILFAYAACGVLLLLGHRLPNRLLLAGAGALFVWMHLQGLVAALPMVQAEEAVRLGRADPRQIATVSAYQRYLGQAWQQELAQYTGGYWHIVSTKLREHPFWQLRGLSDGAGEYLPLMTLGLVLQRTGFFANPPSKRWIWPLGLGLLGAGLLATLGALAWLWPRDFPPAAMDAAMRYGLALPHAAIAFGYAVLLLAATPRFATTELGRRVAAAGRMAFSNYLATSLVMTAIFYGWGLGWFGRTGPLVNWLLVLLGWALMLAWSAAWLRRWRRGPLEWLWRSATEGMVLQNRR